MRGVCNKLGDLFWVKHLTQKWTRSRLLGWIRAGCCCCVGHKMCDVLLHKGQRQTSGREKEKEKEREEKLEKKEKEEKDQY